jgi:hypothetical protein
MLKAGYALLMVAGACVAGFVVYHIVRLLVLAPGIHTFLKAAILIGAVGLILVLAGLIRERRKEAKDDPDNDRDD